MREKDNGWEISIECGDFYRELVYPSTAKAIRSLAEFMRAETYSAEVDNNILGLGVNEVEALPDRPSTSIGLRQAPER